MCEKLRANESTKSVPIIVISALSDNEAKQKALEKGASAFYTKPFSPTALLKELEGSRRRSIHLTLAAVFGVAWIGTFVTGIFFL